MFGFTMENEWIGYTIASLLIITGFLIHGVNWKK
ncbi:hypothetical protein EMIT0194P_20488 [Pseudomonas serbica]